MVNPTEDTEREIVTRANNFTAKTQRQQRDAEFLKDELQFLLCGKSNKLL